MKKMKWWTYPERESKEVNLYFANGEYIETEMKARKLVGRKRLVEFGGCPLKKE